MSEVKVDVPDHVYESIVEWLDNMDGITVTVDELKSNQDVTDWLEADLAAGNGWNDFEDGLENLDLAEELGLA